MFDEQILAFSVKEEELTQKIESLETELTKSKSEIVFLKKAKRQLEKLEEQLSGQAPVSDQ